MADGTGQFIKDYMFPKSKEDTVSAISRQLGAYREIKEKVDDLEHRIEILDEVHSANQELVRIRADRMRAETSFGSWISKAARPGWKQKKRIWKRFL